MDNKKELLGDEKKKELTEQEKKELKELEEYQEKIGKVMDEQKEYNNWLKEHKDKLQDPKYILYRLPLSHEQREQVFQNLMKEHREKQNEKKE